VALVGRVYLTGLSPPFFSRWIRVLVLVHSFGLCTASILLVLGYLLIATDTMGPDWFWFCLLLLVLRHAAPFSLSNLPLHSRFIIPTTIIILHLRFSYKFPSSQDNQKLTRVITESTPVKKPSSFLRHIKAPVIHMPPYHGALLCGDITLLPTLKMTKTSILVHKG
jgi:hypothetical protein